jgi:hypothetical protein
MGRKLDGRQVIEGIRIVIIAPVLFGIGAVFVRDYPWPAGFLMAVAVAMLVIGVWRLWRNERVSRQPR